MRLILVSLIAMLGCPAIAADLAAPQYLKQKLLVSGDIWTLTTPTNMQLDRVSNFGTTPLSR